MAVVPATISDFPITVDAAELGRAFAEAYPFAARHDPARPSLEQVYLEARGASLHVVACDGSRLGYRSVTIGGDSVLPVTQPWRALISRDNAETLSKRLRWSHPATLTLQPSNLHINTEGWSQTKFAVPDTATAAYTYPDFRRVFPDADGLKPTSIVRTTVLDLSRQIPDCADIVRIEEHRGELEASTILLHFSAWSKLPTDYKKWDFQRVPAVKVTKPRSRGVFVPICTTIEVKHLLQMLNTYRPSDILEIQFWSAQHALVFYVEKSANIGAHLIMPMSIRPDYQ